MNLDTTPLLAIAAALGWASGLRLYAVLFLTGAAGAAVNASPEPFSNIGLSLLGDGLVPAVLWLSWTHPLRLGAFLALALAVSAALVWVLAKFLRALLRRVAPRRGMKTS